MPSLGSAAEILFNKSGLSEAVAAAGRGRLGCQSGGQAACPVCLSVCPAAAGRSAPGAHGSPTPDPAWTRLGSAWPRRGQDGMGWDGMWGNPSQPAGLNFPSRGPRDWACAPLFLTSTHPPPGTSQGPQGLGAWLPGRVGSGLQGKGVKGSPFQQAGAGYIMSVYDDWILIVFWGSVGCGGGPQRPRQRWGSLWERAGCLG